MATGLSSARSRPPNPAHRASTTRPRVQVHDCPTRGCVRLVGSPRSMSCPSTDRCSSASAAMTSGRTRSEPPTCRRSGSESTHQHSSRGESCAMSTTRVRSSFALTIMWPGGPAVSSTQQSSGTHSTSWQGGADRGRQAIVRECLDPVRSCEAAELTRTVCNVSFSDGQELRTAGGSAGRLPGGLERMTGIEPAFSAWETEVPLPAGRAVTWGNVR